MKAGLVTFYNTNQSGPLLRAAALERAAEALGVSCEIIAYQPDGQSVQSPRRKNTSGGSRTGPRISGHCFSSLEELQSADAIEEDIDNDVNYFLVFLGGKLIGYFAWKMENTALHLMHLYLKPEYRGKAIGRDIVQTCERLAKGEGKGRVWCTIHAKALPVQQFFKALRYRELRPAEQENGTVPRNELVYEHTLS